MAIRGGGHTIFYVPTTTAAGVKKVRHIQPSGVSITGESEEFEALGLPWSPGVATTLASGETSFTVTGEMTFQKIDLAAMEVIFNTEHENVSSVTVPEPFQTTITSDTATVTGLTADENIVLSITTETLTQDLEQILSAGTPTTGQFEVSADTITFAAAEFPDGTQVTGARFVAVTEGKQIGGNSASTPLGDVSFYGDFINTEYTSNMKLWIPKLNFSRNFSFDVLASGEDVTVNFTATTDSDNSMNFPVSIILPTS